jgi:hypothetical protein
MRGMGHNDPMETVNVTHEEGNEGEKIGVKRGFGAFDGAKSLKRQGEHPPLRPIGNGDRWGRPSSQFPPATLPFGICRA